MTSPVCREVEAALDWVENGIEASRESEAILRGEAGVRGSPTERAQKLLAAEVRRLSAIEELARKLAGVLVAINDCPLRFDEATFQEGKSVNEAPPYQVVVNLSCAWTKVRNNRELLSNPIVTALLDKP